jgi:phage shock protein PspC (stress-responsive transcriptional regulator)
MDEKRSRLRDPAEWTRDVPGRKLAGVCASLAENLGVPVLFVRVGFLVLAFIHLAGILLYAILWMLMPPAKGEPAALDEVLDTVRGFLGSHLRQVDDEDRDRPEPDDRY